MLISDSIFGKPELSDAHLLYGISDRRQFACLSTAAYLQKLIETSADIIQWREKDLSPEENRPLIQKGIQLAHSSGKIFLVNSFLELAIEAGADGIHLPGKLNLSRAVSARSEVERDNFLIGKSVHSIEEGIRAAEEGADYVLLSPIFAPLSKQSSNPPLGLQVLKQAVEEIHIPVFALGGVEKAHFSAIFRTRAAGPAGISWVREEIASLPAQKEQLRTEARSKSGT